jgi:hypothetical protein
MDQIGVKKAGQKMNLNNISGVGDKLSEKILIKKKLTNINN